MRCKNCKALGSLQNDKIFVRVQRRALQAILGVLLAFAAPFAGHASLNNSQNSVCSDATLAAANQTGVPVEVLYSISLAETGRKKNGSFSPWPWTVNMEGKGVWFDSRNQAFDYVQDSYLGGARSFDIGCFQINYRWHGHNFSSIQEMFDPEKNAIYAARFLKDLYQEMGNWEDAAGAYHSRTPEFANKYKKRFKRIKSSLPKEVITETHSEEQDSSSVVANENLFPLLRQTDQLPVLGSLVPMGERQTSRFIASN
ncbi:lytic transglycosylase domain-containing protein [Halocynthiibacter sp. C4]|uniref:lytic transglycosylase domain-containing protein n=1 Tax=Halocynthiibacter sp. C4 TaxID=2992758 RepID=UPI00237A1133|nr:lytic transglycosylase domain-containing protein [Halocynthiibacter sp. C4]MDE0591346.1 lytic transglycosylase domain-containing protein [Halocynthiibacter sp. C4]